MLTTTTITVQREPVVSDEMETPGGPRMGPISTADRTPERKRDKKTRACKAHLRRCPTPSKREFVSNEFAKAQHQAVDERHDKIDCPAPYNRPDR